MDGLSAGWQRHRSDYPAVEEWVIDLDNGPAINSHRTQFIKRIVEFAQLTQLKIRLVYYRVHPSLARLNVRMRR